MHDAFAAQNRFRFAEIIADIGLFANPIQITPDAGSKIDLRLVTGGANTGDVTGEMAHFPRTKLPVYFWSDVNLQRRAKLFRDFANRRSSAAAHVHWQTVELVCLRGQQVRARDVFDK